MRLTAKEMTLVRRAIRGDAESFGTLYEQHLEAIYRYVYFRVSDHHDAEDLTETVFLKAWQAIANYELDEVPFVAWLYRIAHNTVIDHYRRTQHEEPLVDDVQMSDRQPLLEGQIVAQEKSAQLVQAIRRLPPMQQHVVILRFIEGLTHAEAAAVLHKEEGTVRVLQHRALKQLQLLLVVEETKHG